MRKDIQIVRFVKAAGSIGGGSVGLAIILFGISIYEHLMDKNIPAYWLVLAAAVFFTFGAYRAWLDQFRKVQKLETEAADRTNLPVPVPRFDIHVSQSSTSPNDGPPRLGMRAVQPDEGFRRGGLDGSYLAVEFRLRHLGGRPATSVTIPPIQSQRGYYSIRFDDLSFLASSAEEVLKFEVWRLDQRPSRKAIALGGGTRLLSEFVRDSDFEGNPTHIPFVVWFRDGNDSLSQRFRLLFDRNTEGFQIIDDYPPLNLDYHGTNL
jgi:hypothetical protein